MQENQFLDYPEIASLTPTPEKLVVLLHGLGSDGNDLINLVPYIQKAMPACHFISPHGIEAYDISLSGSFNMTGSINGQPGVINQLTSSFAISASRAISSSFATTASHALNAFLPQWSTEGGNATLSQGRHVGVIPSLQYNGSSPRSITITLPNGQIGDVIEIICNNEAPPTPSHTRNLSISYPNGQIRAWGPSNKITSNGGSVSTPQTNTEQPTVRLIYTENNRWNIVYYMDEALATSPSASYDRLTFT
jgi:hypothetical protein